MASLATVRDALLISRYQNIIDDVEFALLYDERSSRLTFPYLKFERFDRSEDEDDYEYEFPVLSTRTSKNVGLQTLCACSVRKTGTRSRPRPPI